MTAQTPGQADDVPFHWYGTMADFDAEVRRRWIEASERLGLDHGMPNAAAAIAAREPQPVPELADDVHVDWHMTPQEWGSLSLVLSQHADVPYIARLIAAGKVPAPAESLPARPAVTVEALAAVLTRKRILVDVNDARHADDEGLWLVAPARPRDLAVQLLSSIDTRLTDDAQEGE